MMKTRAGHPSRLAIYSLELVCWIVGMMLLAFFMAWLQLRAPASLDARLPPNIVQALPSLVTVFGIVAAVFFSYWLRTIVRRKLAG